MAKIRLNGKVVTDVVAGTIGQNNTRFIKYVVQVSTGGQVNNNPRLANTNSNVKHSFFSVMAFGKQAEQEISKGMMVELDGSMEISDFQLDASRAAKQAVVVNPELTIINSSDIQYAKAYNLLGNLVQDDAEVYYPQSGGNTVYTQKLATSKKVNGNEYASFYRFKLFGDRGEKLFSKQLLNKVKVKSVLIDGSITAIYSKKEDAQSGSFKEYFNVDINVNDFQIASFKDNQQQSGTTNNTNSYGSNGYGANTVNSNSYNANASNSNGYDANSTKDEKIPF